MLPRNCSWRVAYGNFAAEYSVASTPDLPNSLILPFEVPICIRANDPTVRSSWGARGRWTQGERSAVNTNPGALATAGASVPHPPTTFTHRKEFLDRLECDGVSRRGHSRHIGEPAFGDDQVIYLK